MQYLLMLTFPPGQGPQPLHAARAELLRQAGDARAADAAYAEAIALSANEPERAALAARRTAAGRS